MRPIVLVSACLAGMSVRYDGASFSVHEDLKIMIEKGLVLTFCPEVQGGLSVPRLPAEIRGGNGRDVLSGTAEVIRKDGASVTDFFIRGAELAAVAAIKDGIKIALLKDGSPACGSSRIYDGTFSGSSVSGCGVAAALLKIKGLRILSEKDISVLFKYSVL